MKPEFSGTESLRESFFDNMLDGLAYCQLIFGSQGQPIDFVCIEVNKNFERLTGLKEKKVIGKKATEILPGVMTSNPDLFEMYGRVCSTGKSEGSKVYLKMLARWFFIFVYSPKKNFFVVVFQDITNQKQIENDLEDANRAAQNVLEDLSIEKSKVEMARAKEEAILLSIGDGLLTTDEKGNIMLVNEQAEKLLGKKSKEVIGKLFSEVLCMENEKGQSVPFERRPIRMALTTNSPISELKYYYVRKDKTKFPVAIMVTPVIFNNKAIGTIEIFRDITREREIDKAKSEFVSLASHQLRTPLTTISWYTEMILRGDVGQVVPSQKKYLQEIYQGNRRMIELVNTLLDVSRIELGTFLIKLEPTDVLALARNVLDDQKTRIEQKKLVVAEKFSKNIQILLTNPKLLHMVFQNLLTNAVEYTPSGGNIEFSISLDDARMIRIEISDTGYGIPKYQQGQIFTKFFRADNVRDKDMDGTGLGLYIVKSTVENSGGKIWFESEENKGTTFHVMLPLDGK